MKTGTNNRTAEGVMRCDFCGEPSPRVQRIALDGDYERLVTSHREKYACWKCSKIKEEERLGLRPRIVPQ